MGYNFFHMYKKGREETIIMRHDVESLNKRSDMMLSCCPPMQEIDYSLIKGKSVFLIGTKSLLQML